MCCWKNYNYWKKFLFKVSDHKSLVEKELTLHFIQNLAESEYNVALYRQVSAISYTLVKLLIFTTYNDE